MVYLNDILIYSKELEDHKKQVCTVLTKLRDEALYLSLRKCEFYVQSITFLGFVVEPRVMKIDPIKIKEIINWLELTNIKGVQSFLGFCNYCRKFLLN
jgi:hypothetical protein